METTIIPAALSPKIDSTDLAADPPELDPILQSAGRYRDDPFWEEMQDSIRQHRREMDAEWDSSE